MLNVFWGDRFLAACDETKDISLAAFCAANGIPCERRGEAGEYVVFPVLNGVTVALHPLQENEGHAQKMAQRLSKRLSKWGTLVFFLPRDSKNLGLIKLLQVQILLALGEKGVDGPKTGKLRFFYSLREKKESLAVIASIARQLLKSRTEVVMEISTAFDIVKNLKYMKHYLCKVPTVLLEIAGLDACQMDGLERAVLNAILEKYGSISLQEQSLKIDRLKEYIVGQEQEQACGAEEEKQPEPKEAREMEQKTAEAADETDIREEELACLAGISESATTEEDMSQRKRQQGGQNQDRSEVKVRKAVAADLPAERTMAKRRYYGKKQAALFPPGDGPVYQFEAPQRNNVLQSVPRLAMIDREHAVSSFNDELRKTAEWIAHQDGGISNRNAGENESVSNSDDEHII